MLILNGAAMLAAIGACVCFAIAAFGCAAADKMTGIEARLDELAVSVQAVGDVQAIGDVAIGGDGDSVVSWIQAVGLVVASLFYGCVWRPVRHWAGRPSDPVKVVRAIERRNEFERMESGSSMPTVVPPTWRELDPPEPIKKPSLRAGPPKPRSEPRKRTDGPHK